MIRQRQAGVTGLRPWVARAVAERINRGALDITDPWALPELLTDLVTDLVTQQTVALQERLDAATAELDAANDAVTELIAQLEEANAGRESAATVHGSMGSWYIVPGSALVELLDGADTPMRAGGDAA
jgi:hypothetical protein